MIEETVTFKTSRGLKLSGALLAPDENLHDVVVFAHGTGSNKSSPRNRGIAERLLDSGVASFLFDFTGHGESDGVAEQSTQDQQFDDLTSAFDFITSQSFFLTRFVGINGSSTGGTVAIHTAAEDERVSVMVLRVPRNHEISAFVPMVQAPTLVLQGSEDKIVLPEAKEIYECLTCPKELHIVEGAGHLFDDTAEFLQEMTDVTCSWFEKWFRRHAEVD
ncbi:MAG: alpha/beta hydrolase [Armatimonadetes bacterium]|jgi:alpha-beta hydrolase superfamily lysophospholipase|nr:alpha/beta hydrolase [Armatimonadota bacterium]